MCSLCRREDSLPGFDIGTKRIGDVFGSGQLNDLNGIHATGGEFESLVFGNAETGRKRVSRLVGFVFEGFFFALVFLDVDFPAAHLAVRRAFWPLRPMATERSSFGTRT